MLTKPESVPPLRSRILRAGAWTLGGYGTSQAIRLASNLIMARLLVPEAFGVMAIATVVQVGVSMMSDLGLRQSVVQNPRGAEPQFLDTIWIAQIVRGFIIAGIATLVALLLLSLNAAGWISGSNVYADPILPYVITAVGATAIANGFESTNMATANRTLSLGHVTMIEVASQIGGIVAMICFAFFERSVWALVFGGWTAALIRVGLSHVALPGRRNQLKWHSESWRDIHGFGRWIFLSSVLGFLASNLDRLMVAGYLSTNEFAFFSIAMLLLGALQDAVKRLFSQVCFPTFSEVARNRPDQLKKVYYKFRLPFDLICLFASGFLLHAGDDIIRLLYDDRYQAAGPILSLLSISLFALRFGVAGQCYIALGRPDIISLLTVARIAGTIILLPALYALAGQQGLFVAIAATYFVTLPFSIYVSHTMNLLDPFREIVVLPVFGVGLVTGALLAS